MMQESGKMKKALILLAILTAAGSVSCREGAYPEHKMVLVQPGTFIMGSDNDFPNEAPAHRVIISKPYYIGAYEVTFEQYDAFTVETNRRTASPEISERGSRPAMGMHWIDAVEFCNWLSEQEGYTSVYTVQGNASVCDFDADGYRLPTEAEWEFAARGGNSSKNYTFAGSNSAAEVAWHDQNAQSRFRVIGLLKPNELGLFDMSGNMWEWCWDFWDPDYYKVSPTVDPKGPDKYTPYSVNYGAEKSRRSNFWLSSSEFMRVTARSQDFIRYDGDNGIRLVRSAVSGND